MTCTLTAISHATLFVVRLGEYIDLDLINPDGLLADQSVPTAVPTSDVDFNLCLEWWEYESWEPAPTSISDALIDSVAMSLAVSRADTDQPLTSIDAARELAARQLKDRQVLFDPDRREYHCVDELAPKLHEQQLNNIVDGLHIGGWEELEPRVRELSQGGSHGVIFDTWRDLLIAFDADHIVTSIDRITDQG